MTAEPYPLDISALENVITRLKKEHAKAEKAMAQGNDDDFASFRTSAVKQFEMAYELSIKTMRHYFELVAAIPSEIDEVNYRTFLRMMAEAGLNINPDEWGAFRQERNKAVHTYFEPVADSLYRRMPDYIASFERLLDSLRKKCT